MQIISLAQADNSIYSSPAFSVFDNRVVQGNYLATALSSTEITSNYVSQTTAFKSPLITFKFSINGLDNEMLPGVNHEFVCLSGNGICETPVITFGTQYRDKQPIPANTYLKPNTMLKIRLDMRPVLAQFEKSGYYTNFKGTKIYKSDFKSVYVVGNTIPLAGTFDNLASHPDLQLTDPDGDGIYEVVLKLNPQKEEAGNLKTWKLTKDIAAYPQYQSPHLLETAIYNMSVEEMTKAIEKDSTLRTGIEWPGVWTRDVSYSIILSMAYMQPKVSENSLMRKVNANGRIIQDTGTGGAWPASTDRMIWAVAAWEIYQVTGDRNWLKKVYPIIKNSIGDDLLVDHDPKTGLVKGESSFLDWREQTYPRWMQPVDIYSSKNLGTNALHYQALTVAAKMAELMNDKPVVDKFNSEARKIKDGINHYLWIPEKNYYGQYRYGRNYQMLSPRSEALGEALCVVFNVADKVRQKQVVQNVPVVDYGIPCIYPQIGDIPPYHNNAVWPFVQTYWLWAGAKTGNEGSVLHSMASIYRAASMFLTNKENFVADNGDYAGTQINSSNMLWSLSGNISIIHKVLFGIRFEENGLRFEPFVPRVMSAKRELNNFRYRNATLDIELTGSGNRIASFELDGKVQKEPVIPPTLTGKHRLKMVLANNEFEKQPVNLVKNESTPLTPVSEFENGKLSWSSIEGATSYRILKNGQDWNETTAPSINIPAGESGEFQVMAVGENNITSFASEPVRIYPESALIKVETESRLTPAALPYHGFSGNGFVEISRTVNRTVNLDIDVPTKGLYAIDWCYANGNGPTNTENKCAIRTLFVDNNRLGAQVFPQRGKGEWSNWGFSNAVPVQLKAGKHTLRLEFRPEDENMNIEINQAMLDYVRLVKIQD
ncbi:MAG: GH116 family glycosyl hydrolase [Bacteroidota bacterium]|nr:GH116 family glycosyl hydrolase [Bacteroidota bacterium]